MKRSNNLVFNVTRILLNCRKPILLTHLKNKTTHESKIFYYYIEYLSKLFLIIITDKNGNKEIEITEKGRELLKVWIEINNMLGVKICQYL